MPFTEGIIGFADLYAVLQLAQPDIVVVTGEGERGRILKVEVKFDGADGVRADDVQLTLDTGKDDAPPVVPLSSIVTYIRKPPNG